MVVDRSYCTPVRLAPFQAAGTPECRQRHFPKSLSHLHHHPSFTRATLTQKHQLLESALTRVRYSFLQASFSQLKINSSSRVELQKVNMPPAKGKPTDLKLKEKVTEGMLESNFSIETAPAIVFSKFT